MFWYELIYEWALLLLAYFGPILLQASCVMIGVHQPSENPIDMMLLQLIMQPIWKRQIQARDPVWMKIVNKTAAFLPQESQLENLVDSQLLRLEGSDFAGVHEV